MRLATLKRAPVSVDAVVAQIGGTAEQLTEQFSVVGIDFMGRPMIAFEDAKLVYEEALRRRDNNAMLPMRFEAHQEERMRRRQEAGEAAKARARESFVGPHRVGAEVQRWLQVQWDAERAARAEFDAREPEITISQFREREKAG